MENSCQHGLCLPLDQSVVSGGLGEDREELRDSEGLGNVIGSFKMGVRLTGFRGVHEGTNRQESTGIDRGRVCPCGARRTRSTAQGRGRVGSGAARRATRFLSTPVDSCRLGSGAAWRDEGVREGPRASGAACVRGRIDRSRVCPCGAKHETATAQGRGRVGSGAARRDEAGWRGCFDIHEPLRKGVRPRVGALRRALDRSFAGGLWRAVASRAAV